MGESAAVAEGLGVADAGTGLGEFVTEGCTVAVASGVSVGKEVGAAVGPALQDTTSNNKITETNFFNFHLSSKSHDTSNQNSCQ